MPLLGPAPVLLPLPPEGLPRGVAGAGPRGLGRGTSSPGAFSMTVSISFSVVGRGVTGAAAAGLEVTATTDGRRRVFPFRPLASRVAAAGVAAMLAVLDGGASASCELLQPITSRFFLQSVRLGSAGFEVPGSELCNEGCQ